MSTQKTPPRVVPTLDAKPEHLIVDHADVTGETMVRGREIEGLALALELEGRVNHGRRRSRVRVILPPELIAGLVIDMTVAGLQGHREFAGELISAVNEGVDRVRRAS